MRESLTVIIALLILAVVLDGLRRMRHARRGAIRMSARMPSSAGRTKDEPGYGSELPNGGARVVKVRKGDDAQQLYRQPRHTPHVKASSPGRASRIPQQVALNLDEHVPTLMEVESDPHAEPDPGRESASAGDGSRPAVRMRTRESLAPAEHPPQEQRIEPRFDEDFADLAMPGEAPWDRDAERAAGAAQMPSADEDFPYAGPGDGDEPDEDDDYREPELVLVINVMAPKGERFRGDVLLETVLEQGMRFGGMNIFHHHADNQGKGPVLYSMANIIVPGTFDLASMRDDFTTPGVSLFLALPVDADSSRAFESMLKTARAIAEVMGGELKDENRSVMTAQTIEHYRSRIKEFERKQLSRHV